MSSYLAVGGVSALLRWLLSNALTPNGPTTLLGGGSPGITATSPDLVQTGADEAPHVNIFMYYASLNPALRNESEPSRNARGEAISNPPLALNLHYLVTAYGAGQFDPEILLGWAMKVFHDTPVVPRAMIESAMTDLSTNNVTPEGQLISGCLLATQFEHIRITPEALTTEEIYRLWTAFQTSYRPTTSYQVSVVVIQDTASYASNRPVQRRGVLALPSQAPVITSVAPNPVLAGGTLTILGQAFTGDTPGGTLVSFDNAAGLPPDTVQGTTLRIAVPATLQAGTRTLRVQRTVTYPISPAAHAGFSSSPMPFQLLPVITQVNPASVARGSAATLSISPAVGSAQQVVFYLGDTALPIEARALGNPPVSQLALTVPASFATGKWPVRIEVDGAQSRIALDTTNGSPTYGQWLPQLEVTP